MVELPHQYFGHPEGYLCLEISPERFAALPEQVEVFGALLTKKTEFHVTLMALKTVAPRVAAALAASEEAAKEKILEVFARTIESAPITLSDFINDFRFAEKDSRKSVLLRCDATNLEPFFAACEQEFGITIPRQPTHVTLYTLQRDAGIGINSPEEMAALPKVELPQIAQAFIVAA